MLKTISIFIFIMMMSQSASAQYSLRRCVILPITDTIKGSVGNSVFNRVEEYLKSSNWCYYQSNSGLIDILNRYQHKLTSYLKNPEVLKVIARKTEAGSLINIAIGSTNAGIELEVHVYGENGTDVYYHEKVILNTVDIEVMGQTVINWLEEFNSSIPYDVRISGILGDSFTLDMGRSAGINSGDKVELVRPTKKKRHPLFKEIVDWETIPIAEGKIVHVTELQAQGKVTKYANLKEKIKREDWGLVKKGTKLDPGHKSTEDRTSYSFGKLGEIGFSGTINSFSVSQNSDAGTNRQSGILLGGKVQTEIWVTREYWTGFQIEFHTGSIKADTGSFTVDNNSLYTAKYRIEVGYKYLPIGFFYGPQVDFFAGYENDTIALDNNVADGIVGVTYSGIIMGAKANIPIYKKFRLYTYFDFLPFASFKEDVITNGEPDGISSYQFKFGMAYNYKQNMNILVGVDLKSSKASYDSTNSNITHKRVSLVSGIRFTF